MRNFVPDNWSADDPIVRSTWRGPLRFSADGFGADGDGDTAGADGVADENYLAGVISKPAGAPPMRGASQPLSVGNHSSFGRV